VGGEKGKGENGRERKRGTRKGERKEGGKRIDPQLFHHGCAPAD